MLVFCEQGFVEILPLSVVVSSIADRVSSFYLLRVVKDDLVVGSLITVQDEFL